MDGLDGRQSQKKQRTRAPPVFRANRFWGLQRQPTWELKAVRCMAPPFKQSIAYCVVPLALGACHLTLRLCFKRSKKKTGHSCWRESRLACPLLISHAPPLPPPIPSNRLFIFSLLLFPNLSHLPNLFKTNTRTQHAPSRTHTHTNFFFSLHMPTFFFSLPVSIFHTHIHSRTMPKRGWIWSAAIWSVVVHFCNLTRGRVGS